jgi:hypothetical protein
LEVDGLVVEEDGELRFASVKERDMPSSTYVGPEEAENSLACPTPDSGR